MFSRVFSRVFSRMARLPVHSWLTLTRLAPSGSRGLVVDHLDPAPSKRNRPAPSGSADGWMTMKVLSWPGEDSKVWSEGKLMTLLIWSALREVQSLGSHARSAHNRRPRDYPGRLPSLVSPRARAERRER